MSSRRLGFWCRFAGQPGVDPPRHFWQTNGPMANLPRGFIFRNRRWFLAGLAVLVFVGFAPFTRPVAERLALLLNGHAGGPGLAFWRHACYGLAAVLIGIGAFLRTWGSAYLGAYVVQDRQLHTERLVGDGPYRRTRNPLYFGNMFMVVGLGCLLDLPALLVLVFGMWILVRLFIRDEEAGLEESGGESYRAYRAAVPRLLPSWRPRVPSAGARPRWLQGFCGESMLWALAIVTLILAVTLNRAWFGRHLLIGLVIALPLYLWARRHTKKQAATGQA